MRVCVSFIVDKSKARHESDPKKRSKKEKEEGRMIKTLQNCQARMAGLNMRSAILLGVIMIGIFWTLNSHFSGTVVAKLPFEAISIVRSLSHRNLPGNDFTVRFCKQCAFGASPFTQFSACCGVVLIQDCSLPFLYAVCSLGIKANLKKLVGGTTPKVSSHVPSMFTPPPEMSG